MTETNSDPNDTPRIVVVGSINMDLVARVPRLPGPGETITGSAFEEIPGGKGANQAVAAARLGAACAMVGRIGDDGFGQKLRQSLSKNNVDVTAVRESPDTPSGVAMIAVDHAGENTITVIPGANDQLCPADIAAAEPTLETADAILVQLEIPLATVAATVAMARRHGVRLILDPAPMLDDFPTDLLRGDVLCPNATEAQQLTGITICNVTDAKRAATWLAGQGTRMPVITLGSGGAVFADAGRIHHVAPFPVEAVDTTAAGDAFAAALAVAFVEGQGNLAAVRFACAAGALAASRRGAQPAMPARHEVDALDT